MSDAPREIWPERLKIRDTGIHDDLGGSGRRIYTTAGNGYERREYISADIAEAERDAAYNRGLEDAAKMCAARAKEVQQRSLPVSAVNELMGMSAAIRAKIQEGGDD